MCGFKNNFGKPKYILFIRSGYFRRQNMCKPFKNELNALTNSLKGSEWVLLKTFYMLSENHLNTFYRLK